MFLVFAKRNKTKIIQCDHGGGFSFKNVPMPYIQKKFLTTLLFGENMLMEKNSPTKKNIY